MSSLAANPLPVPPRPASAVAQLNREFAIANWRVAEKLKLLTRASESHFGRSPDSVDADHIERLETIERHLAEALMDVNVLRGAGGAS